MKKILTFTLILQLLFPTLVFGNAYLTPDGLMSKDYGDLESVQVKNNENKKAILENSDTPVNIEGNSDPIAQSGEPLQNSTNCVNSASLASGHNSCDLKNITKPSSSLDGYSDNATIIGSFGKSGFGKESIYCKECWSKLPESKLASSKDDGYDEFLKDLNSSYRSSRVENWRDRVAQFRSQLDVINFYSKQSPKINDGISELRKSCPVNNVKAVFDNKILQIINKYKDSKDRKKLCPNYHNILSSGFFSGSKVNERIKKDKSSEDIDTKRKKAAKDLLAEDLPGIENVDSALVLEDGKKGEVDAGTSAEYFCRANDVLSLEYFKFDEFKFFNLMVDNIKQNGDPKSFAKNALKALKNDRRFGFDSIVDNDDEEEEETDDLDRDLLNDFSKMYTQILAQKGEKAFANKVGESFKERTDFRKSVQESLASILNFSGENANFRFEAKLYKSSSDNLKKECASLFNEDLEALICGDDQLLPTDQELILSLDEDLLKCYSTVSVNDVDLSKKCHNFKKLACKSNPPEVEDSEINPIRASIGSSFQKVQQFNDRRLDRSKILNNNNDFKYSCRDIAKDCIESQLTDLKTAKSAPLQNIKINECVQRKMSDRYATEMSQNTKSKKSDPSMQDEILERYLAYNGRNCQVLKGPLKDACVEKLEEISSSNSYYSCANCGDSPSLYDDIDDLLADGPASLKSNIDDGLSIGSAAPTSSSPSTTEDKGITSLKDPVVNPRNLVSNIAPAVVDQLKNQVQTVDKEVQTLKKKNESKGLKPEDDPEYLAKLAQKETLDKQLRDLQASIAKAKDDKTISDLKRELEETKDALVKSKQQNKNKSVSSNAVSANGAEGSSASGQTQSGIGNRFSGSSNGNVNSVETPSPYSGNNIPSSSANGKFGSFNGGSSQDFSSGGVSISGGVAGNGNGNTLSGKESSSYSLGVNGYVRNVSNDVVKKLEKQNDIPVLMITSAEVDQVNHNPDFVKMKCPTCYERGVFKAIIEDAENGKNVAYLSVKKDGQFILPEVKRSPAAVVEKPTANDSKSKDKAPRVRIKKEDMDKAIESSK